MTTIKYYSTTIVSIQEAVKSKLIELSYSNKFFDLVSLFSIFTLSLLSIKSLTARTHISFWQFPVYIFAHVQHFFAINKKQRIYGIVIDKETKKPLAKVSLSFYDPQTQSLVVQITTNKKGYFYFETKKSLFNYLVISSKHMKLEGVIDVITAHSVLFKIELEPSKKMTVKLFDEIKLIAENLFGFIFEGLLLLSFIAEILFMSILGFQEVFPFLLITVLNLTLWIFYLSTHKFFR